MTSVAEQETRTVTEDVTSVPVDRIDPSPRNRRLLDDDPKLAELAENLRATRLINPITVRPVESGRFEIVCGERRWRAFRILARETIPAFVIDMDDRQAQIERITENMQRERLTPLEQGDGVAALLEVCGGDYSEVAARLDCTESWVRRRAKLPNLTPAWREELAKEETPYAKIRDSIERLEEIAMLPRETQDNILESGLLMHVSSTPAMRQALARYFRDIEFKPWSRAWEKKNVSGRKRCDACLKRSDKEKTLFGDVMEVAGKDKLCLDPECWNDRVLAWCKNVFCENPETHLLWDGYQSPAASKFCKENFASSLLPGHSWREQDSVENDDEYFSLPATGLFVGGARVGQIIDIYLANDQADKDYDRETRERRERERREEQERRERFEALHKKIDGMIPGDIAALAAAAGWSDIEQAVTLLNWASWFGVGETRFSPEQRFDVLNVTPAGYPGKQHVWSQIRSDIVTLIVDKVSDEGDDNDDNDWAVMTLVTEALSINVDDLQHEFNQTAPEA